MKINSFTLLRNRFAIIESRWGFKILFWGWDTWADDLKIMGSDWATTHLSSFWYDLTSEI